MIAHDQKISEPFKAFGSIVLKTIREEVHRRVLIILSLPLKAVFKDNSISTRKSFLINLTALTCQENVKLHVTCCLLEGAKLVGLGRAAHVDKSDGASFVPVQEALRRLRCCSRPHNK